MYSWLIASSKVTHFQQIFHFLCSTNACFLYTADHSWIIHKTRTTCCAALNEPNHKHTTVYAGHVPHLIQPVGSLTLNQDALHCTSYINISSLLYWYAKSNWVLITVHAVVYALQLLSMQHVQLICWKLLSTWHVWTLTPTNTYYISTLLC